MAGHVYALVVGIDDYPDPRHRLFGCVNDARAVSAFLDHQVPAGRLSLKPLLNGEATRKAVIDGFRQHLAKATAGDTVCFYYAGHGSQERAPEEFWKVEPDHLDETLVCHDSRTPGGWDLADKELALLLREVAANKPHTVVVLDCCHSGSGTRATEFEDTVRRFPTDTRDRPVTSFLPGVLEAAERSIAGDSGWDAQSAGQHVLMAACRDDQEAKEYRAGNERRGAFSWFLLDALQTGGARLSYRELHKRAKSLLEANVAAQSPQLEATDDRDLDRPFLGGDVVSQDGIYSVARRADGAWVIDAGRVHGIAAPQGKERTELAIFPAGTLPAAMQSAQNAIARAHVASVHTSDSVITCDSGSLAEGSTYCAVVTALPLPLSNVRFSGDPNGVAQLEQAINTSSPEGTESPYLRQPADGHEFAVKAVDGRYELTRASDGRPLTAPVTGFSLEAARTVVRRLEHIARWARVVALANPASRLSPTDVTITLYEGKADKQIEGTDVEFSYRKNAEGKTVNPTFRVKLKNDSARSIYCGLIGLSQMYGVTNLFPQGTLRLESGQEAWVNEGKAISARIPPRLQREGVTECTDILKLIATTTEFDVRLLAQPDVDEAFTRSATRSISTRKGTLNRMLERVHTRALDLAPDDDEEIDDFVTASITIKTIRPRDGAQVSAATPAALDAGVEIATHPHLRAVARLSSLGEMGRDIGKNVEPLIFRDQPGGVVPLQLTAARGADQGLSALELVDLVNADAVTPEDPLRIKVPLILEPHEVVLPIAHDGEFFIPVGHAVRQSDSTMIEIVRLPEAVTGRRSLTSAIRIAFHKLVLQPLGVAYKYPLLACVDLDAQGNVKYETDLAATRQRVAGASRIVLFIHGIIGDTRQMASVIAAGEPGELVMAFDYENLHTTIERNAELLRDRLAGVGLVAGHGKDFQIVAHSMGGLISRWFIECLGGKAVVSHLVMAGTPNAGSPWPTVEDWATTASALVLNGFTGAAWPVQALGWIAQGVERIDNALDEMKPGSDFLRALAVSPDPAVPYTILAGNTSVVAAALGGGKGSRVSRLLAKINPRAALHTALTLALFGESNDIAVTVTSIKQVDQTRQPVAVVREIGCDHITYFTTPDALQFLRGALKWPLKVVDGAISTV
jgi:hypothetical protein